MPSQRDLPLSKRSLGQRVAGSILVGLDRTGRLGQSVRRREEEEREAERQTEREERKLEQEIEREQRQEQREVKRIKSRQEFQKELEELRTSNDLENKQKGIILKAGVDQLTKMKDGEQKDQVVRNIAEKTGIDLGGIVKFDSEASRENDLAEARIRNESARLGQ